MILYDGIQAVPLAPAAGRSIWALMCALVVFGSRACAGGRPESALDLLVILKEAKIRPEEQIPRWQEVRNALEDVECRVRC